MTNILLKIFLVAVFLVLFTTFIDGLFHDADADGLPLCVLTAFQRPCIDGRTDLHAPGFVPVPDDRLDPVTRADTDQRRRAARRAAQDEVSAGDGSDGRIAPYREQN